MDQRLFCSVTNQLIARIKGDNVEIIYLLNKVNYIKLTIVSVISSVSEWLHAYMVIMMGVARCQNKVARCLFLTIWRP